MKISATWGSAAALPIETCCRLPEESAGERHAIEQLDEPGWPAAVLDVRPAGFRRRDGIEATAWLNDGDLVGRGSVVADVMRISDALIPRAGRLRPKTLLLGLGRGREGDPEKAVALQRL